MSGWPSATSSSRVRPLTSPSGPANRGVRSLPRVRLRASCERRRARGHRARHPRGTRRGRADVVYVVDVDERPHILRQPDRLSSRSLTSLTPKMAPHIRRHSDRGRRIFGPGQRGLGGGAAEATLHRHPSGLARRGAGLAFGDTRVSDQRRTPASASGAPPAARLLRDDDANQGRRGRACAVAQCRASACRDPHNCFHALTPGRRAIASATERSSRARSGPVRRRTTGSSPTRSRDATRRKAESDRADRHPDARASRPSARKAAPSLALSKVSP